MKLDDILVNRETNKPWKIIDICERYNLATIESSEGDERIVNIKGLDIDYILDNGD